MHSTSVKKVAAVSTAEPYRKRMTKIADNDVFPRMESHKEKLTKHYMMKNRPLSIEIIACSTAPELMSCSWMDSADGDGTIKNKWAQQNEWELTVHRNLVVTGNKAPISHEAG